MVLDNLPIRTNDTDAQPSQQRTGLTRTTSETSPHQSFRKSDRGQMIVMAGLVVAFVLVGLILLLNTVLFTENLGTRGEEPGVDRARDYQDTVNRTVPEIMAEEHAREYTTDGKAIAQISDTVNMTSALISHRQAKRFGSTSEIYVKDTRSGKGLKQSTMRNFTAGGGTAASDWTLAETRGVRDFTMTVDSEALLDVSLSKADQFHVEVVGASGGSWEYVLADDAGSVELVAYHNGNQVETCTSDRQLARINWMDGTLNGKDCGITFADGLNKPYTIQFENGDGGYGTYSLIVSDEASDEAVRTGNFYEGQTRESPRYYDAAYSLTVDMVYQTEHVQYKTGVRYAPNETEVTRP